MHIVQISDTHIMVDPAARFDEVDSAATLQAVLAAINARERQPDLMLLTGDLVHDPEPAAYERLDGMLASAPAPVYCLPGNHDHPATMRNHLHSAPVRHDKHIQQDGWQILSLDSWLPDQHAGLLFESELEWLDQTLSGHPDRHALIALHHPPVSIGSPWMDSMGLRNPDEFFAVLDRHPQVRAVIWGHIHQEFETQRHGVRLLACPSTCVQFKPRSIVYAVDDPGPGYRWLELHDDGRFDTGIARIA